MRRVRRHVLEEGETSVAMLDLGCITQDWQVPARDGERVCVVLGYADPEAYRHNPCHIGVIAGRVANRIADARFVLDGQVVQLPANDGPHHLHGGPGGLGTQFWDMSPDGTRAVQFTHRSPDGAQGYPGELRLEVTVTLRDGMLSYLMQAESDRPTPVSLAQHSYYNLMGQGGILDHRVRLRASRWCETGPDLIPTGRVLPVDGTALDFRKPRRLGDAAPAGVDTNFMLDPGDGLAAEVAAPNGLGLRLWTDQPGLQLYTGTGLARHATPLAGQTHAPFSGFCLEPQHPPDAVNRPGSASVIITPERPYRQLLTLRAGHEVRP